MSASLEYKLKPRNWYGLWSEDDSPNSLDVYVYDEIGMFGVTAKDFIDDVSTVPGLDVINLHINSPGGDVFAGTAIYNYLTRHKAKVNVYVDGMAASIASIIAMAGDKITMPENAFMFVHNPWTVTAGNADDLHKEAAALNKMQTALVGIYTSRTGLTSDEVQELLDAETWLTAEESVAKGFADEVESPVEMAAKFDMTLYKHIPVNVATQFAGDSQGVDDMIEKIKDEAVEEVADVTEEATEEATDAVESPVDEIADEAEQVEAADEVKDEQPESVEEPEEPDAEPVVAEETPDARAEFSRFVDRFGNDRAAEYYQAGLSFDEAERRYLDELIEENADLKAKLAIDPPPVAVKVDAGNSSLWETYSAISDPAAKRAYWNEHKNELIKEK